MAFRLEREKTKTSPYVLIEEERGYIRLEGESYLEDVIGFFVEITEWLTSYLASDFKELTFDCAMEYFNSSTTKQIYNMLRLIDSNASGKKAVVTWIVPNEDDDMLIECGEDYRDEMENLEFNLVIRADA
jgi:predicted ATP-grasp superfamily ATP-dependent carboligase